MRPGAAAGGRATLPDMSPDRFNPGAASVAIARAGVLSLLLAPLLASLLATPACGATLPDAPEAAARRRSIELGESRIHVALPPELQHDSAALLAWVERCARAVANYYAGFPVRVLELDVRSWAGDGIHGGQALPTSPPTIRIRVGQRTSSERYERNWSLTHEMVHLAFPNVPKAHHWIEEGLATYVEPIARARAGWITEQAVWAEWIDNMPRGLPVPGDGGLDGTASWGRTYWGGALYCLLADVEIRKRSQGRHGLPHALRAIVAAGANIARRWPLEQALRTGDEATGTTVLIETYHRMKDRPLHVDLDALWKDLGVERRSGRVVFDDSAPLAAVRRGIVSGEITPGAP
jgi:hypothetical protein